jgi:hypothetical protein
MQKAKITGRMEKAGHSIATGRMYGVAPYAIISAFLEPFTGFPLTAFDGLGSCPGGEVCIALRSRSSAERPPEETGLMCVIEVSSSEFA